MSNAIWDVSREDEMSNAIWDVSREDEILVCRTQFGMFQGIADSIHLQGTVLYNAGIDCKHHVGSLSPDAISKIRSHLRRVPLRHDELEKKHVNDALTSIGCSKIFTNVKELRPDNGERFFMQCFHQQKERSKFNVGAVESKRCQCENCFGGATEAASVPVGAVNAVPGQVPVPVLPLHVPGIACTGTCRSSSTTSSKPNPHRFPM